MTQDMINHLYGKYRAVCNEYVRIFCEKYDFEFEPDCWAGGSVGEIANIGDFFINFNDIVTDCNEARERKEYFKWYDYNTDMRELHLNYMNYSSWLKGAPRVPQEVIDKLRKMKDDLMSDTEKYKKKYNTEEGF